MLSPSRSSYPLASQAPDWGLSPWRQTTRRPYTWGQLAEIDDSMRNMERQFNKLSRWMDSAWSEFGRELGLDNLGSSPVNYLTDVLRPEVVEDKDGNKKYQLNVQLGVNFPAENVKVSLKDRVMKIEAKTEQKSEDGNSRVYREVSRQCVLPKEVDVKEIKSVMGPNGVLKVEAPLPQQALPEPPKPTEIPIHLE